MALCEKCSSEIVAAEDVFYDHITEELYHGTLPDWQREPIDQIIAEGERREQSIERISYVLATAHHETARFKYMEEIGGGTGHQYGEPCRLYRNETTVYYGRGFVQLTWLTNYAKMSVRLTRELGREIDLVTNPGAAAAPSIASPVIWEGMHSGLFTGKNLADYINDDKVDYFNARRIVNGLDKAELIKTYAETFEEAFRI